MNNERINMPNRSVQERIMDFKEVPVGYSLEQAIAEAKRCIQCKNPKCVPGCPVEVNIPAFIAALAKGDVQAAVDKIKETNALPAICGRVCPQEEQCERKCILGIKGEPVAIGNLERFAADWEKSEIPARPAGGRNPKSEIIHQNQNNKNKKIAVIGSGPAGLTCAADLALLGYQVTIFESLHVTGGVLRYGIPEFRLPKSIVDIEVEYVKNLGVEIKTDMLISNVLTIDELQKDFQAIFIGSGAGLPKFMGIPGESLEGVYSANEFLFRVNMMKAYLFPDQLTPVSVGKNVAVVGAGNVAMDSARVAKRLGAAKVSIIYRRSREEMPARRDEIKRTEEEDVEFKLLTNPEAYHADSEGKVFEIECIKMELGEPDTSGRRRPVPKAGSNFKIPVETVVVAIGNGPNPLIPLRTPSLKTEKWGGVIVDQKQWTSIPKVSAGGDIVRGSATVISAMGDGKRAAKTIDEGLNNE
ncbi:NADPH-dependent glutamate synthase [Candidatus Saganbacteria bacterium]|nr:NADPH-dependent glutamate synthase [Candidatus Saganbacteria bacterium]